MTRKNSSPKRQRNQQYSVGSLAVMLFLVLAYWWLTGTLPGSEQNGTSTPVADLPAIATAEVTEAASTAFAPAIIDTPAAQAGDDAPENPTMAAESAPAAGAPENDVNTVISEAEPTLTSKPTAASTVEPAAPTKVPTVASAATATPLPQPTATTPPKPTATPTNPPRAGPSGMPTIKYDELPREAIETIILIAEGGPFPFDRDGIPFQNRERLLPNKPRGYYAEYTVITPGASTRGARRIIAGENGEIYYTDDHYESFYWVMLP